MSLELSGTTPAIKGVAGSVSAPAITGDDVDTGISFPSANTIKFSTGGVERMSITDSGVVGAGGGKILQVVSTEGIATVTATGTVLQLLTISITPAATSSKILILATVTMECVPSSNAYGMIHLYRGALNGTEIFNTSMGDNHNAYNYANLNINYVDTPGVDSQQSYTTGINRASSNTTSASTNGTRYTLIAMEIGA